MYQFLAKQGQHEEVAASLGLLFNSPVWQRPYNGRRGQGVMVQMPLPDGVSKRTVDRSLYRLGIVGAVPRRNLPIIKAWSGGYLPAWEVINRIGADRKFVVSVDGKLKKARVKIVRTYCDCCGDYPEVEYLN